MRTCTMPECDRKNYAKAMCKQHYIKAHREIVGRQEHPKQTPCANCGTVVAKVPDSRYRRFCDLTCRDLYSIEHRIGAWGREKKPTPRPKPTRDLRSPLRRALEDGDTVGVIAAIKADSDARPGGCWEWRRQLHHSGYAKINIAGRSLLVHRLALEARLGAPLGKQPAHHVCANTFCVNPDHLVPVTAAENIAEMLARRYMESRITDLEAALAGHDPSHPLLTEVGVVRAA